MYMSALILGLASVLTLSSAQNIYEGCGSDKECLGFLKGDGTQACMQTEVIWSSYLINAIRKVQVMSTFQDCTLVLSYKNSTNEGYAEFEVMHKDAGEIK